MMLMLILRDFYFLPDVMISFNDAYANTQRDFYFLPDVMISFNDAYANTQRDF